ncbi:MAG: PQQ-dependent sugar dehydrogenase [Pseudomonadota bacterium]|nr:PQQ-dependent sugar dehydrogenase [Pseudomonadota bacterium]
MYGSIEQAARLPRSRLQVIRVSRTALWAVVATLIGFYVMLPSGQAASPLERATRPQAAGPHCDQDNGGINLPAGLCATVFADNLGLARHLTVTGSGTVYVHLEASMGGGATVALRDTTGDGRADQVKRFGDAAGTGIGILGDYLYVSSDTRVLRYRLPKMGLVPQGAPEVVIGGFPAQSQHTAKPLTFDESGHLYINIGAPSNACQREDRAKGSPGMDPCPLLKKHGGIWRFDARKTGQQAYADGVRFATGLRNIVALQWNDQVNRLYAVQMGRDQLTQLFPQLYTPEQSAKLPAEEFFVVQQGDNFGWPYCYYDWIKDKKVLSPEYGGNGKKVGYCDQFKDPIMAFPGHWSPMDLVFYYGDLLPARYRKGAFIAFHGSWNRAPKPQAGYKVAFVPFKGGAPNGDYQAFATGFAGEKVVLYPGTARFRPSGLAVGPDGSLYIADSVQGRIWRVIPRPGG